MLIMHPCVHIMLCFFHPSSWDSCSPDHAAYFQQYQFQQTLGPHPRKKGREKTTTEVAQKRLYDCSQVSHNTVQKEHEREGEKMRKRQTDADTSKYSQVG